MKTRVVDTREYVSALRELTEKGEQVSLTVAGGSMAPFLVHGRDVICFEKPKQKPGKGEIVFYQRKNGQYVAHRICRVTPDGYYIVGDAQWEPEGLVTEEQVFAVVTAVRRKGKWIGPEDFWWKFFAHVWIRVIPFRCIIMTVYERFARLRKRK